MNKHQLKLSSSNELTSSSIIHLINRQNLKMEMCDYQMAPIKILDPVLEFVELPPYVGEIINTAEFQRLRNIKKMSIVSFVIPSANHTLYEHSIGFVSST